MSIMRPKLVYAIILIEIFIGIMGISSAVVLLYDPSGVTMGIAYALPYLPIPDFTLLGLWFLTGYGILPLFIAYFSWRKESVGWKLALGLSIFEVLWILSQLLIFTEIGYFFLQPVILIQALITIFLLMKKSVKAYFGIFL